MVDLIRQNTSLPCAVGFGIATPQQAAAMAKVSDGAIVGSAIIKFFAQYGPVAQLLTPNFYTTWRQLCAILKINNDWGHWMNRILIVEDEITISRLIAVSLRRAGYDCTVANDGSTAADLIAEHDFDLALLDIMLPGLDGYELLGYLRPLGVPVIFITAKGATKDRVRSLQLGADDYIVKPFEIEELLARVEAVLRRTGRGGQTLTAFDVTMDIVARTVTRQGKAVELTPREFDLLEQLMRNRGAALYRDVLYGRVWGGDLLDSRTLDLHIQRLRKKLGWADKIETVYRVGYRLKSDQK